MAEPVLTQRSLNRATLARQMLLERRAVAAEETIEHLVGMQAQAPNSPYVGLWARLQGFGPDDLVRLITERRVVRAPLMRATIHLVSARDCLELRPVVQPVLDRGFATGSPFGSSLAGVDVGAVVDAGRALLAERPRTRAELAPLLTERWPDLDPDSLAYAVTYLAPLVQVPPRGLWGRTGPSAWTTSEAWLGRPVSTDPTPDRMVLRYLAAFGPASVRDVQMWSGLTRLREVLDRLRPQAQTFRDEGGTELFDLPQAPRPDADTPAPPRFLPEYDNVQFGHADRTRIIPAGRRPPLYPGNGGVLGTVLVGGMLRATWKLTRQRDGQAATLTIEPDAALGRDDRDAVEDEGRRLLAFSAPDADTHHVRLAAPA